MRISTSYLRLRLFLSLLIFGLSVPLAFAQSNTVTGTIKDTEGLALPGVNVLIKGTTIGTITDTDGKFSLEVPGQNQIIVISFVGYRTQEIQITGSQDLNITLDDDLAALDEVVVVGYGTEIKRNVTGAVSTVKGDDIARFRSSSVDVALQGAATGVQVVQSSGIPGSPARLMIRGTNSLSNSTEPLYVIDGIPITDNGLGIGENRGGAQQNPLSLINPNDIASVEILKDAAATSIYGNRGSNGVIIITTKRGKEGRSQVNIDYSAGITDLTRDADDVGYVNGPEYLALVNEARANSGLDPLVFDNLSLPGNANADAELDNFANTNWFDEILRTGSFHDFNVSSAKGFDKGSYYFSTNYRLDEGVLLNNRLDRVTTRLNLDIEPIKNIKTGLNFTFAYTNNRKQRAGGGGTPSGNDQVGKGGFGEAIRGALPIFPVRNPDGSFFIPTSGLNLAASINKDNQRDEFNVFRFIGGTFLEYSVPFLKGLSIRSEFSADIRGQRNIYWAGALIRPNNSAFAQETQQTFRNINYNIFGTYKNTFGEHSFNVVVGAEYQKFSTISSFILGEDLRGVGQEIGGTPGTVLNASAGLGGERNLSAVFARFNYVFKDRYILGFSGRRDGTSVFTEDNRHTFFPAVSAGWIISEENFIQSVKPISFLKIRGSYGVTGNQGIQPTATTTTFLDWPAYSGTTNALEISNLGVPTLVWEETESFDVALEFGFLQDRINGSVGYFQQDVTDLLLRVPVPQSAGLQFAGSSIWANVADVRNSGFEININSVNIDGNDFKWTTSLNFTTNQNEVQGLTPDLDQDRAGLNVGLSRTIAGLPIGTYYLAEHAGVDPETGVDMIYFIDQRATIDGEPNPDFNQRIQAIGGGDSIVPAHRNNVNGNRRILDKSGIPKFFGGLTNTFTYKGFELTAVLTFQGGNYIYDTNEESGTFIGTGTNLLRSDIIGNTWTQPGDNAEYPQLIWNRRYAVDRNGEVGTSFNQRYDRTNSTRFLQKGDFLRFRTLQLAYNLPNVVTDKLRLSNLRVFVGVNNLFTITGYDGWDPEIANISGDAQNRNLQPGVVSTQVPTLRTWMGGLNIQF